MITTSTNSGYWESQNCTAQALPDREVWTYVYEGFWDSLITTFGHLRVGDTASIPDGDGSVSGSGYQPYTICGSTSFMRKRGGLGEVRIQYIVLYTREIWNIDFAEVSKDIKVWLVDKGSVANADGSVTVQQWVYDGLTEIAQWENQKEISNYSAWAAFKYDGKKSFSCEETLLLAKKMMKGITNFPIYTPSITRTTIHAQNPVMGNIGCVNRPTGESGWSGFGGFKPDTWINYANVWLKTAERSNMNSDGTFTLVEQWIGADELDPDLYPTVN